MKTGYKDHYQVLGVGRQSTQNQIKDAFRSLSMIHHPDKNRNSEKSNRIYRIILNAYKILSDIEKRQEYDEFIKRSEYIKNVVKDDKVYLSGQSGFANTEILDRINITLWEIEGILTKERINAYPDEYILIILTFLDKWILEPYGFPDYFMEARRLERKDPREYIKTLGGKTYINSHLPYNNVIEYYYDIRKRSDKFITKYEKKVVWEEDRDQETGLIDRIIEYNNMAIHYLSYLLNPGKNTNSRIPLYEFSNTLYNYTY